MGDLNVQNWIMTICGNDSDWITLERLRGTSKQVAQYMLKFILADIDVFADELECMDDDDALPKSVEDLWFNTNHVEYELEMPEFHITYRAHIEQEQIDLTDKEVM